MKSEQTAIDLRAALVAAERKGAGRAYPEGLRHSAARHWGERERGGDNLARVAAELGVSGTSLLRWSRRFGAASGFRAVEVIGVGAAMASGSDVAARSSTIVVHGPRGVRIEGLTVAEVADLVGRLS